MGEVNITLANGGLGGTIQTNDGVCGLVMTGGIDGGGYVLGTCVKLTGLSKMAAEGITTDGNEFAVRQITDYYTLAGDGAELYVLLCENTVTVAMMADNTYSDGAKKLLDYANGRIRVLGLMTDDSVLDTPTITNGLNADVYTAATNMGVTAAAYFAAEHPFRCVIAGTSFSGVAEDLTDQTSGTNNRTGIFIGDTETGVACCLGLLLGMLASIPVERKISRIRNGALPITAGYIGTDTVETLGTDVQTIRDKGYMTLKRMPNLSGYFFSSDPMLTATTDDYATMARGRVIDKLHIIAYTVYVQEVDDEVPITTTGTIEPGFARWLEQQVENQVALTMIANKEVSSVKCFVDPAQNVLSTNEVAIVLKVVPVGYLSEINITLGFSNPALA